VDPVDAIWLACARRLGFEVRRTDHAWATFDGASTIGVAPADQLDADDCLAQILLHELCHALVAGEPGLTAPDWGLASEDARDLLDEHACHRLQAALADRHGLRAFVAVTTEWRPYYEALPADPLTGDADAAVARAREAFERALSWGWFEALDEALAATADVAAAVGHAAPDGSLWREARPRHPLSGPAYPERGRCEGCAWHVVAGPGPRVSRCLQRRVPGAVAPRIPRDAPACALFEPALGDADCPPCGACCRQGYGLVPVPARSPLLAAAPELITRDAFGAHLARPDGHCVALDRGPGDTPPYRCRVYPLRPTACRDFAPGGEHCLEARRRVRLSARPPWAERRLDRESAPGPQSG